MKQIEEYLKMIFAHSKDSAAIILLMEDILHQLIGSLSHYLNRVFYIPGAAGFLPSTVVDLVCTFYSPSL